MKWDRSNVLGLARVACKICQGHGMRISDQRGRETPCYCVFRAVFRACYNRFRECNLSSRTVTISLGCPRGPVGRQRFSRKREEYMADFCLISRRVLDDYEHRIFRYHFLLGADWRLCARMLKMDRGNFFHLVYRIQQKLGCAFAETSPYALFPVTEYFDVEIGQSAPPPCIPPVRRNPNHKPLILPLSA
jgi:hypothetical protein